MLATFSMQRMQKDKQQTATNRRILINELQFVIALLGSYR